MNHWGAYEFRSVEADDVIAILHKRLAEQGKEGIVVSIDKDLYQIPGRHYHIVDKKELEITPQKAIINYWKQVLTGDNTDDIKGIYRVGDVKAEKILSGVPPEFMEDECLDRWVQYSKTGRYKEDWRDMEPAEAMAVVRNLIEVGGDLAEEALGKADQENRTVQEWLGS
jgi:5'-3' exonuclease